MSGATAAALVAVTFAALYAGHQIGDHVVQSDRSAVTKGAPDPERLAMGVSPWSGWGACLLHVASYTATQAAALALVCVAVPMELSGMGTALVVSASTHAVIDRRWIVRWLIHVKKCHNWREAPYAIDQSLHVGALLVAAVLAVVVSDVVGVLTVATGAVVLMGAALTVERRLATSNARVVDPIHG
ncbi:DUF3307 domain-containing protein [Nonomuraea sp. LP-02]|uniref:DUF3307 domain-containing protein n=1 Tax=Nonomuraea sp. LP-02 TaxID=3097960 RepID=UPI002E34FA43|nr:DUF3307 domain-containing protein [Nonomuraea sp. LP-02]MED7930512.1 DUF3307 domain-containing protein [Nonomuraea sp. LP-02]